MVYPLPTEHERRALFWWLEQASSLTAWRRLYSYHQRFVEAVRSVYEEEQRTVGMKQTIDVSWFASVLNGQDAFDAALERLRAGDRRCFDFLGARGHFSEGLLQVEWWQDMFVRQDRFAPSMSPRWREIGEAMHDCLAARLDISLVLQDRSIDAPAPIGQVNLFMSSPFGSLMKWWLERTQLPAVPIANPEVLVATGQVVPCYGIWEPVQVAPTLLGKLFGSRPASPPPERPLDGCMNYLHGGSAAPTIQFEGARRVGKADPRRGGSSGGTIVTARTRSHPTRPITCSSGPSRARWCAPAGERLTLARASCRDHGLPLTHRTRAPSPVLLARTGELIDGVAAAELVSSAFR